MIFETLKSFIEYIPNCIICQKPLRITIGGLFDKIEYRREHYVKMKLVDGKLVNVVPHTIKNKKIIVMELNSLIIDPLTNEIIEGLPFIHALWYKGYVKKYCSTCNCCINGSWDCSEKTKKITKILPLELVEEGVSFTLERDKSVSVINYANYSRITYENKIISQQYTDFTKISTLEKIKNRIKTILVFQ